MKKVLKIAAALMTAAALFVSCSSEPETKYVDRIVEVEVPVSTTTEDATTVLHMEQSLDGKSYALHMTENKIVPKGTELDELKKPYDGFTALGLVQSGDTVMILYQRNTVNVTFDYDGGKSSTTGDDGLKEYSVLWGTSGITAPANPVKEGYHFNYWTVDGTETEPAATAHQDVVYKADYHEIVNYTVNYVSVHGNGSFEYPCHTSIGIKELEDVDKGSYISYFKGWYSDAEFKTVFSGELTENVTLYAQFSEDPTPKGFVEVQGMTIASSNDYASFGFVNNYKGVFGRIWVSGTGWTDRTVTLSSYYIGINEVTKDLYKKIMSSEYNTLGLKSDPSSTTTRSGMYVLAEDEADYDGERPVESVTWFDAVYFCNVYSQMEGLDCVYTITNPEVTSGRITNATVDIDLTKKGYRLPTEAEWEFAARGGHLAYGTEKFKYDYAGAKSTYVGNGANYPSTSEDTAQFEVAWCDGNAYGAVRSGQPGYGPHRTGQKKPNALGIFDMSGNVDEWCNDWGYSALEAGAVTDPCIWNNGIATRIKKGGSFASSPNYLAIGAKNSGNPNSSYGVETGFRLVRTK